MLLNIQILEHLFMPYIIHNVHALLYIHSFLAMATAQAIELY